MASDTGVSNLIPFTESHYRVDGNMRMLCGHSYGGFGLFSKYFISSPSINYKQGITYQYESDYAGVNSDLRADIFMSCGEAEQGLQEEIGKMSERLLSRNYQNFHLKTAVFEGENHVTRVPGALSRGLVELFRKN